jgi:predicted site-specific integrase-resolvase
MNTSEVLNLLKISRPTLYRYLDNEYIKTNKLPNGRYEFEDQSIYSFLNKDIPRKNYIYARVSTYKQKNDLKNQLELLKQFCFSNGIIVNGIYQDIASGIDFEKREEFFKLLEEIIAYKV